MGFYPVCPGTDQYVIGAPLFDRIEIDLPNGNRIDITAEGNSDEHRYVDALLVDGEVYTKNYFTYSDLMDGAEISFRMSSKPNTTRGTADADLPYSMSTAGE